MKSLLYNSFIWFSLVSLFLLTGSLATRGKTMFFGFFWKLHARLPVFRHGPIFTGGYKHVSFFCHIQRQSRALLHVLARMSNVAHHAHDMCGVVGVGGGWAG